jgi:signal transduction histidine kinase
MGRASKSQSLDRQVLDALPVAVCTLDLDGRIILVNHSWAKMARSNGAPQLGDERAVVGALIGDFILEPSDRAQIEDAMATLREGRATSLSWEISSGSPADDRVFLVHVSALGDAQTIAGYTVSTVDVTPGHRRQDALVDAGLAMASTINVDRALHEAAQQLRLALACDEVAIALADEDSSTLRLAHHSGAEEASASVDERLMPVWLEALAGGQVITHVSRDGTEITAPMRSSSGVIGAVTISTTAALPPHRLDDIRRMFAILAAEAGLTIERAWLIRRTAHKRRLEAVGEASAGIAHELRNPLFGISSAAQLLRFRVKDDPVIEKNVGRILREVERLNNLATVLTEYGRPTPMHLESGDPDVVWDEVLESQRGLLESRALLLQRTRAKPAARCAIDAQQLSQAMVSLLANAADAAPEGTDLTLRSTVLENGAWRCRLQNGGAAIPPEVLPRVFEIFFSTKPGNTGIGLALCQRIIEGHGGSITLESGQELGTAATIVLPPAA